MYAFFGKVMSVPIKAPRPAVIAVVANNDPILEPSEVNELAPIITPDTAPIESPHKAPWLIVLALLIFKVLMLAIKYSVGLLLLLIAGITNMEESVTLYNKPLISSLSLIHTLNGFNSLFVEN